MSDVRCDQCGSHTRDGVRHAGWGGADDLPIAACDRCRKRNPPKEHRVCTACGCTFDVDPGERSAPMCEPCGDRYGPFLRLDVERMLTTDPPPVDWVVEPLAARGHLTMLVGREGQGKSMLTQAVAVTMANGGGEIAGLRCRPGRTVLIDAENGEGTIHRRIRGLGLTRSAGRWLDVFETHGADLRYHVDYLRNVIEDELTSLVVVDSFRRAWNGDENASAEVDQVLSPLRQLARDCDVAIVLVHHARKAGDEYRGDVAIGAAVEIIAHLTRDKADPEAKTRRKLEWPKHRLIGEPPASWLHLRSDAGRIIVEDAEPFESTPDRPPAKWRTVADRVIDALTAAPMKRADVARAVGEMGDGGRPTTAFANAWRWLTDPSNGPILVGAEFGSYRPAAAMVRDGAAPREHHGAVVPPPNGGAHHAPSESENGRVVVS